MYILDQVVIRKYIQKGDKMKKDLKIAMILGIMCFFLTAGIVIQINTVSKSTTTVGKT